MSPADAARIDDIILEIINREFYTVNTPNGETYDIDKKYIDTDGGDCIGLNEEAIAADNYEVPGLDNVALRADNYEVADGILRVERRNEELYTTRFQPSDPRKAEIIRRISPILTAQPYNRDEKGINETLNRRMKNSIRTVVLQGVNQGQTRAQTGMIRLKDDIVKNTAAGDRGVNSEIELNAYVCAALLEHHDNPNAFATGNLPPVDESLDVISQTIVGEEYHLCATEDVTTEGCQEGVKAVMKPLKDYLEICKDVGRRLIDQRDGKNAYGNKLSEESKESIINVRLHTGLNVSNNVMGPALMVSVGGAILVKNKNGKGGDILVRVSGKATDDGEIFDPTCVGALLKQGWDEQRFETEGPYVPYNYIDGTYYMGLYTAYLYKVFNEEELSSVVKVNANEEFRRNLVDLGNGLYMTRLKIPKKKVDDDGLPTYSYGIKGKGTVSAHQLMARIKREIGTDTRGWFSQRSLFELGYVEWNGDGTGRALTPEEAFPIHHREDREEYEDRDGIPYRLQSETSDNEHHFRDQLVDNNCIGIHDTNHPRNTDYIYVASHKERGSGYTNFAHTIIRYKPNSTGNTRDRDQQSKYNEAHRKKKANLDTESD